MSGRRQRLLLVGVVVAVVAAVLYLGLGLLGSGDEPVTLELRREDFPLVVEATGTLRSVHSMPVTAPALLDLWQYTVVHMVPEGAEVEEGDLVARLDAQQLLRRRIERDAEARTLGRRLEKKRLEGRILAKELAARMREAQVGVEKARLKTTASATVVSRLDLARARIDLERAERELELTREKVEAEYRAAEAELKSLESRHSWARQRLRAVEEAIRSMELLAPRAGLVIHATDWRGDKIKVGESIWRGWKVVEMPDLSRMEALVEIDEADARHVKTGQEVEIVLDAQPDVVHRGTVESLSTLARRSSRGRGTKVFDAVVSLERTVARIMRPGMRVAARVVTERIPGVLAVPETAVEEGSGAVRVYVNEAVGVRPRDVRLGERSGGRVVVREGLEEGEVVCVEPPRGDRS